MPWCFHKDYYTSRSVWLNSLHNSFHSSSLNKNNKRKRPNFHQTIEWSSNVGQLFNQIQQIAQQGNHHACHFILPDLDHFTMLDKQQFYNTVSKKQQRIQTIAACQHTEESLMQYLVSQQQQECLNRGDESITTSGVGGTTRNNDDDCHVDNFGMVDKYLIVGGNHKNLRKATTRLSSVKAIEIAKQVLSSTSTSIELWGVANPNDANSTHQVMEKIKAGASGIITQPLFTEYAPDIFMSYPRTSRSSNEKNNHDVVYIAGLAFPKSTKGLLFWSQLLTYDDDPSALSIIQNDSLFQKHIDWFERQPMGPTSSLIWAQDQFTMLNNLSSTYHDKNSNKNNIQEEFCNTKETLINGIHYMPMKNARDLISLLSKENENTQVH